MYELNAVEIDEVNGGIRTQILRWAEAIGLADMVNDAIKGLKDGFEEGLTDAAERSEK